MWLVNYVCKCVHLRNKAVSSMVKKENVIYTGIDIAKLIFSILIVCLHLNLGNIYFLQGLYRIATPMFFCISGFFSASKVLSNNYSIVHTVLRLMKSYLFYSILYIPISLKFGWYSLDIVSIVKAILYRGTFIQLWFYPALIESIILLYLIGRKIKSIWIAGIAPIVCYVYGILSIEYHLLPNITSDINNVIFHGLMYFWLGIAVYKMLTWSIQMRTIVVGLIISIAVFFLEITYLLSFNDRMTLCFSLVPLCTFLMLILLKIPVFMEPRYSLFMRNTSTVIFGIHYIIYFMLEWNGFLVSDLFVKLMIIIISVVIAALIVICSKQVKIMKLFY